jgi:hypothetical protein
MKRHKPAVLNFKSKASYKKWLSWGYSHDKSGDLVKNSGMKNLFDATPGRKKIKIRGKDYKPKY